jgi:hypothetical protein
MLKRMLSPYALIPLLLGASAVYADVTVHQTMEFQFKMPMPAAQTLPPMFNGPIELVSRIKGQRAYASFGSLLIITDSAAKQITLVDPKGKRYAATSLADYLASVQKTASGGAAMPEEARQMPANIKVDIQSKSTGRSERIMGIDAAETEIVFHMTIPIPIPGQENGLELTGKFQCWKPKPGEADRVPALGELEAYHSRAGDMVNTGSMLSQIFGDMPGLGENMQKLTDELAKGGRTNLRLHGAFYMPGLAGMMAQARASGADVPDMPGPDSPLLEMRMETTGMDTAPVPDSVFLIPADYQQAPIADLIKMLMPAAAKL